MVTSAVQFHRSIADYRRAYDVAINWSIVVPNFYNRFTETPYGLLKLLY